MKLSRAITLLLITCILSGCQRAPSEVTLLGGEMMVKGFKANGDNWQVNIQAPIPFTQKFQKVMDIREQAGTAIMTAGTYRNFFEENGQNYSHILNPKTGRPVTDSPSTFGYRVA